MMCCDEELIRVSGVSKRYEIYARPYLRLLQMICCGHRTFYREFWALQDISFSVRRGECFGIIGRNGAGKSTLLQILANTLTPTTGTVEVKGKCVGLLELGSGFDPEFTGRENIFMNAAIYGVSDHVIRERYQQIVDFADIGDAIDQPVKTYSSGMAMRLAFAVIAHVDAEVLIIDEALSVGDVFFARKCYAFLKEFMKHNTVVFVTHDISAVCDFCDRVMFLCDGRIRNIGKPKEITDEYLAYCYAGQQDINADKTEKNRTSPVKKDIRSRMWQEHPERTVQYDFFEFDDNAESFGKGGARICEVSFRDQDDCDLHSVNGGEQVKLRILCEALEDLTSPIVGFAIRNARGENLFGDNSYECYRNDPVFTPKGTKLEACFEFEMPRIAPGEYFLHIAVADGTQDQHVQHQWFFSAMTIVCNYHGKIGVTVAIPMHQIKLTNIQ